MHNPLFFMTIPLIFKDCTVNFISCKMVRTCQNGRPVV